MAHLVRDLMSPHPIALPTTASLVEAALAMRDFDVSAVLVLDNGQVCGLVSDRDIVVRGIASGNYPATMTLGEICSRELTPLSPTDRAADAMALMRQQAIGHLPVVEHGQPIGIISLSALALSSSACSAPADVETVPPSR